MLPLHSCVCCSLLNLKHLKSMFKVELIVTSSFDIVVDPLVLLPEAPV